MVWNYAFWQGLSFACELYVCRNTRPLTGPAKSTLSTSPAWPAEQKSNTTWRTSRSTSKTPTRWTPPNTRTNLGGCQTPSWRTGTTGHPPSQLKATVPSTTGRWLRVNRASRPHLLSKSPPCNRIATRSSMDSTVSLRQKSRNQVWSLTRFTIHFLIIFSQLMDTWEPNEAMVGLFLFSMYVQPSFFGQFLADSTNFTWEIPYPP